MKLSETQVRDAIRAWYGNRWFAPNSLKRAALTDTVKGLYIPYWTFDAQVHADWTADSGYYYYETETYPRRQRPTQTRQVQKVRWVPSSGALDHFFDDELVPASRGVQEAMLRADRAVSDHQELAPYNAGYFPAGWWNAIKLTSSPPPRKPARTWTPRSNAFAPPQVPGDTQRNLQVQTDYSGQTFKHILVPIWLLTYDYGARISRWSSMATPAPLRASIPRAGSRSPWPSWAAWPPPPASFSFSPSSSIDARGLLPGSTRAPACSRRRPAGVRRPVPTLIPRCDSRPRRGASGVGQNSSSYPKSASFIGKAELSSALQDASRSQDATDLPTGFGVRARQRRFAARARPFICEHI